MRNLMQHTAGFEEQAKDIMFEDPNAPAFEALLKRWVPERVFAPGTTQAYLQLRASLAGYIVQRVSRRAVRCLCREAHFHAVSDAALDLPSAFTGRPCPR